MEQNLINGSLLDELFGLKKKDYSQYSPLTLAYIGDAVFDLIVRTVVVKRTNMQAAKLHKKTTGIVNAGTQCAMIRALDPFLTDEERAVYRRGRNAKPYNTAKNASRDEYLEATGFEALMGFLYLKGDEKRMMELIVQGLKETGHDI